jgi:hypothetical protein
MMALISWSVNLCGQAGIHSGGSNKAKPLQQDRISQMKRPQLIFIGETKYLFDNRRPPHLIGTHSTGPGRTHVSPPAKSLMNHVDDGRFTADNPADMFQLFGLRVIGDRAVQRYSFLALLALFVLPFYCF